MQFAYDNGTCCRDLELTAALPGATVADLAAALGAPGPDLVIDGRLAEGAAPLAGSGLLAGSTVATGSGGREARPASPAVIARVIGGCAAGQSFPLVPGPAIIGRDEEAAVRLRGQAVSRRHCRLDIAPSGTVVLTDLGSRNGTDLNGGRLTGPAAAGPGDVISVGGEALLRLLPPASTGPPAPPGPLRDPRPGGTIPFARAPRAAAAGGQEPLALPAQPPSRDRTALNLSMLIGSVLMAGGMIVMSQDLRYAAIAVIFPVMMLLNVIEDRTRGRLSVRRGARDFRRQLDGLRRDLPALAAAESARRWAACPDLAEIVFRATGPSRRLWERRPGMADFLQLSAGIADQGWSPPVRPGPGEKIADEVAGVLRAAAGLRSVPVPLRLTAGEVAGLEGDRPAVLALARSLLCQAAVTAGPADVTVAVFADADRAADWDWAKWLPHVIDPSSGGSARLLAAGPADCRELARGLLAVRRDLAGEAAAPLLVVVADGAALLEGRANPLRELLDGRAGPVAGIVVAARLPAACSVTIGVSEAGEATVHRLRSAETVPGVLIAGLTDQLARRCARALARFDDPELAGPGAGLPGLVPLLPLLDLARSADGSVPPGEVAGRWRDSAGRARARATIGVSGHGAFGIDLDEDGPHGLIGGTTGSGKSELLRTLVTSLAVDCDPEHLTFALVDYKGGGGLDKCSALPHVVGLVTDLDQQLGARALRCLEAELRHRERLLVSLGLDHIRDYHRLRGTRQPELEALPRLVVVIDEFATLIRALPGFVDHLVGIAQRGRSLGVHLILATQRPSGSVNENIKNNVKLRIALRLESSADSQDVIDSPAAAGIGGRQRGRAFYRVSAHEVLPLQTALATTVSEAGATGSPVALRPFGFGRGGGRITGPGGESRAPAGPTDLQRLIDAASEAFTAAGLARPRQPWPPPLPGVIPAAGLPAAAERGLQTGTAGLPPLALADDPERQAQYLAGWDPGAGNLLLYGIVGSGTSTALAALALGEARASDPSDLHVYVLDLGAGELSALAGLPHTGAYVGPADSERQQRLIRLLAAELDERKATGGGSGPRWLVLIDNLGAMLAGYARDAAGLRLSEELRRVYAEGPTVGIHTAASADRLGAVPGQWATVTEQKLLFRLADPTSYAYFSIRAGDVPSFVPGRAVVAATGQVVQVAWPGDDLAAAVAGTAACWPGAGRSARPVRVLPDRVPVSALAGLARTGGDPWWLPAGLGDGTLAPAGLTLYEREHALIAGPARSGRSTALCAIAVAALAGPGSPAVIACLPHRSPLAGLPGLAACTASAGELAKAAAELPPGPALALIDDAELVDDRAGALVPLLTGSRPGLHVIAAGRPDALRKAFGHWTEKVRASRSGILLVPDHDMDGQLLGTVLPRLSRMAPVPGRGYLVSGGTAEGIQVAAAVAGDLS